MTDTISPKRRSWVMSRVKGKNTSPELLVRKAARSLRQLYQLHRHDLPGTPDLVFPKRKIAVFVNGCFWHRHSGCKRARTPKTRFDYWNMKLQRNVDRDRRVRSSLRTLGWKTVVIWECETPAAEKLLETLRSRISKCRNDTGIVRRVASASKRKRRVHKSYVTSTGSAA